MIAVECNTESSHDSIMLFFDRGIHLQGRWIKDGSSLFDYLCRVSLEGSVT
jgi:hypothetical protein